jgi:hypothetical protein
MDVPDSNDEMILPNKSLEKVTGANAGWRVPFRIRGCRRWPDVAQFSSVADRGQ